VVNYTTGDQDGCTALRSRSLCAVADIIGKPEGLPSLKEFLTLETNIDSVVAEKVLQFKLSASHSICILAGEAQGVLPYSGTK